ncbi:Cyclic nucleotide-binding domain-containing protein [Verrucomicrobium sp. GAS474]|uniref:Crp/Fnr family transcriptional regulator n=1 Tax=Verrucomicrobium sp. GAS474 TaxID=1882831 RepID=UPI00087AF630|nr:cyclic nucleotide-binding domain-containing protein [Verrucomicrobium sp. GAS474]SDT91490.1 Cyclic nucleotide-binding domain-containing protein [Verrucomicrobium sp. GAS474]
MLTIEKVMLLKSASVFSGVPEEMLVALAETAREREFAPGAPIFAEGEEGTCLYVIALGAVRIHKGDHLLARLGARQVFGELAALDPEPRSASATADDAGALLFEIGNEALYELLADHAEVARDIIAVLCRRLRDAGKR